MAITHDRLARSMPRSLDWSRSVIRLFQAGEVKWAKVTYLATPSIRRQGPSCGYSKGSGRIGVQKTDWPMMLQKI